MAASLTKTARSRAMSAALRSPALTPLKESTSSEEKQKKKKKKVLTVDTAKAATPTQGVVAVPVARPDVDMADAQDQ